MKNNDEMTKMTDWYNPTQLVDTAKKTMISTIIGANADPRLISPATAKGGFFDYSHDFKDGAEFEPNDKERQEIWFDYVSDVGDGWNSTYSVAYTLAQETLDVAGEQLTRGEVLIFGGDGVYPTANSEEYEKKLVVPYQRAFNASRSGGVSVDKTDLKKNPHV